MKTILTLLLCTTLSTLAGPEAWLQNGLLSPELISSLKSELALSSEQEQKMQALVTAARSEGEPLEAAVREQQKNLNDLLRQRETTTDAASAALKALLEAEAPVKQLQLRALLQLRDLLTPEQQKLAMQLAPGKLVMGEDLQQQVKQKAEKLRAAVEALGMNPTEAMSQRGAAIEALMKEGQWAAANTALDQLIKDSRAHDPEATTEPDFSQFEPGNTDLDVLKQRYETVQEKGQSLLSLPLIRQFLKAKEAFEAAKEAQDAERIGRILSWAEKQLAE